MAKQIIVTQNDYGIELETQFVDDKKKPLDITDYDVRVKVIYDDKTIDTVLAEHKDSVNGIAYIVLEKEHLINAGLHTSVWSVVDEDEHVTAQENVYYFVKDVEGSEDDTPTTDLPINADDVLDKFNEIDNNLFELTEQGNIVNETLNNITTIAPKSNDFNELQSFINNLPNNSNLKFPKFNYNLDNVLVFNKKNNIIIDSSEATFTSEKHGYGCIELYNCKNIEWQGGTLIGSGNFPANTFNGNELSNEKQDYKGVWGFRRNGDSKSTPLYNGGYLGNCGIGMLIHQGCENITVRNIKATLFNFSGICIGFRGNGDSGWGNIDNVVISKNIKIMNCYCYDNFSSGIFVCQVDGFEISSCKVENNGHPSATINDYEVDPGYGITCTGTWYHAKNGFIKNNIATNNKRKGIDAHAGENIEISNNIIDNSFIQGIAVVTNNSEKERILDFKITSNTILNCANNTTIRGINKAIIVQGENTSKIIDNKIINSANIDGSYAIETNGGTKIVDGNTIENSGAKASIRSYSGVTIVTNNIIKNGYGTLIMIGDSVLTKVENNHIHSSYSKKPTFIYMNGSESGIISSNSSNKESVIAFGTNTSNVEIFNNNNISVEDTISGKLAVIRPITYTFKIFVGSDGALTFNDYGGNFVKSIESNTYGVKVNFYKNIKNVSINVISADSQFYNKLKSIYLREVHRDAIIVGLDSDVTGYGKPIENFKSTNLIFTLTTY